MGTNEHFLNNLPGPCCVYCGGRDRLATREHNQGMIVCDSCDARRLCMTCETVFKAFEDPHSTRESPRCYSCVDRLKELTAAAERVTMQNKATYDAAAVALWDIASIRKMAADLLALADRLEAGEHCASTSNRNFEGRQGAGGRTHLVSPAMAAAAAVYGHFVDVRELLEQGEVA